MLVMGYICLHNHCYQPPRENPWLEAIELQDSTYPYHDWNERVTPEFYSPNPPSSPRGCRRVAMTPFSDRPQQVGVGLRYRQNSGCKSRLEISVSQRVSRTGFETRPARTEFPKWSQLALIGGYRLERTRILPPQFQSAVPLASIPSPALR